jgi:hypothetical protein
MGNAGELVFRVGETDASGYDARDV